MELEQLNSNSQNLKKLDEIKAKIVSGEIKVSPTK